MKIRHEWRCDGGDIETLHSNLFLTLIRARSKRLSPAILKEDIEARNKQEIYHTLFGPIEDEIYKLCNMFTQDTDAQTCYDKMREIAAMCRNPTWLE